MLSDFTACYSATIQSIRASWKAEKRISHATPRNSTYFIGEWGHFKSGSDTYNLETSCNIKEEDSKEDGAAVPGEPHCGALPKAKRSMLGGDSLDRHP